MHPRRLVRDSVGFTATQYVVRAALMLRGVIAMHLLGPAAYGAWNGLTLLLDFGSLAPLGTQQGLDQAVPARILNGDATLLERIKRAGLFNILALTVLFSGASLLYLIGSTGRVFAVWGAGGIVLAVTCIALGNVSNYYLTLLRSHGNIPAVSTWYVLQGTIGTALGLILIYWVGVWGLLIGWVTATAAGLMFVYSQGRSFVPLAPRPSSDSRLLLRVGLPMFVYMASTLVMRSLDRIIILRFLGTEKLGYYSLSIVVLGFLLYLPDSLAYVLYPHFLRRYHAAGERPEAIRDLVERSLRVIAIAVPALCGMAFLVARDGALLLLPRYLPGASAARIMCFGAGAIALSTLSSIVLMTLGRQRYLIPTAAIVTLFGAGLDLMVVRQGYDITGVAWATFVTFSVSGLLLPWLALSGLRMPVNERLGVMARLFAPLASALALSFALDRLLPWGDRTEVHFHLLRVGLALLLFLIGYAAIALPLLRGLGLRQILSEFNFRGFGVARPAESLDG
jgi:O-antigen/teichoic acid export membrane protein